MDRTEFNLKHNIGHNGDCMTKPINLDAMEDSELDVASAHPGLHAEVRRYANLMCTARACKLAGQGNLSTYWEKRARRVYMVDMPANLRW